MDKVASRTTFDLSLQSIQPRLSPHRKAKTHKGLPCGLQSNSLYLSSARPRSHNPPHFNYPKHSLNTNILALMSVSKSRQVLRASPASFQVSVVTGSHDLWTFSDSHLFLICFSFTLHFLRSRTQHLQC